MNVFVVVDTDVVLPMSCLTTISRLDGWHLTTDGEPSLISFELRGLENKSKLYSLVLRQGKYKKSQMRFTVYSVSLSGITSCKVYIMTGIWIHISLESLQVHMV